MITYYNHPHMTAVPTRPAAGHEPLRRSQRLTGALLYTLARTASELLRNLHMSAEPSGRKESLRCFAELTGNGYLEILEERRVPSGCT